MSSFEKLGLFYLGKLVDPDSGELTDTELLYESKDLTTHAVCVGMTGSGKTGLCISLLEEAAIDNIPAIIIDPKGDLGNLLLTFPNLKASDFLPWVNRDEASQKGLTPEAFAEKQADLWRNGLAKWGQGGERIATLRKNTDLAIYTPGSQAGIPVSIVNSFAAPKDAGAEDIDLLRERIQSTTSGLLALLGIDADPLQSREHILLSNIIEHAWLAGKDLDLGGLIQHIQSPPIQRIGVFEVESFYPSAERFKLAMAMNNLLAAPGFKTWLDGEGLNIDRMLYTAEGKPRTAIFSIAHLADSERMFFVSLLLNQVLGWVRRQSGTTSLRAILYMDEVFGFLPPIGEPPSKKPLLTLLKQARAFGLGVVLATQNPVDLDYKGLSNTGTWFIGRLQTEKDKERLIDGLVSAAPGSTYDKKTLLKLISSLKKRQFLIQNIHESQPALFNTRWALSYLCGPLTREHIKRLMKDRAAEPASGKAAKAPQTFMTKSSRAASRPQLPPEIRQYHAPAAKPVAAGELYYHPFLLAGGDVHIFSSRYNVTQSTTIGHLLPLAEELESFAWEEAKAISMAPDLLSGEAQEGANYQALPAGVTHLKTYNRLDKQYETYVYRQHRLKILKSKLLKMYSAPGESEREFRIRLGQSSHEKRDLEVDRLKRKYAGKIRTLERQLLTARQRVEKETDQYRQKQMNTVVSVGSTLLGALFGGSRSRRGVSSAVRSVGSISKEKQDIARAEERLAEVESRIDALNQELQDEIDAIADKYDPHSEALETIQIRPKKSDILQKYYGILWVPFRHAQGVATSLAEGA